MQRNIEETRGMGALRRHVGVSEAVVGLLSGLGCVEEHHVWMPPVHCSRLEEVVDATRGSSLG